MTQHRAVFGAAVTFSNKGGLQAQRFRVDLPSADVSDELVAELFVRSVAPSYAATILVAPTRNRPATDPTG